MRYIDYVSKFRYSRVGLGLVGFKHFLGESFNHRGFGVSFLFYITSYNNSGVFMLQNEF